MEATAATLERRVRVIPATRKPEELHRDHDGKMRVAAYCRVSTDSEEQLNSYEAQKTYYTQKIQDSPDWEMAGIYADEGISGTSLKKRTQFNKMITACKRGHIDPINTKSLSRFARNTVDCLDTVRLLKANGIGVYFEKENINTMPMTSEYMIALYGSFAQAESESISKNVSWGKQKAYAEGKVAFQYSKLLSVYIPQGIPEEMHVIHAYTCYYRTDRVATHICGILQASHSGLKQQEIDLFVAEITERHRCLRLKRSGPSPAVRHHVIRCIFHRL